MKLSLHCCSLVSFLDLFKTNKTNKDVQYSKIYYLNKRKHYLMTKKKCKNNRREKICPIILLPRIP